MTVTELIAKLKGLEAEGHGDLHVLIQEPDHYYGCGIVRGEIEIGTCDDEGYVEDSDCPDVVMFR